MPERNRRSCLLSLTWVLTLTGVWIAAFSVMVLPAISIRGSGGDSGGFADTVMHDCVLAAAGVATLASILGFACFFRGPTIETISLLIVNTVLVLLGVWTLMNHTIVG